MSVQSNYEAIEARIQAACQRAGRARDTVKLVGVSKKKPAAVITEAVEMTPLRDFGENYVQEYLNKREALKSSELTWHFIGHLQRNKVRQLMTAPPQLIHSVDSCELASQINRVCAEACLDGRQQILVELRIGDEDSDKTGLLPEKLPELVSVLDDCRHLHWRGLMMIPPLSDNPEDSRPYFRKVREIFDALNARRTEKLTILSYGMSDDFEVAIEEGATHIRIGTSLFGARG